MRAVLERREDEIYQRLVAGDEAACRRCLTQMRAEHDLSVLSVCEHLTEAFHSIGDAWACSEISVYREHVASQIGYRLLMDIGSSLPSVAGDAPVAIGCAPEGDPYCLPTLMLELTMREFGWNARSLGTNLPLELLAPAIEDMRPNLCWVSVSYFDSRDRLREQLQFLNESGKNNDCLIVVGGQALDRDLRCGFSDITFLKYLRELETVLRKPSISDGAD